MIHHGRGQAILDFQLMFPLVAHVVDVAKLGISTKMKSRKGIGYRLATQERPRRYDTPHAELKEVDRFLSHRHLEHTVKFMQ